MTARLLLESWFEATLATAVLALLVWLAGRRWMSARWLHLGWSLVLLKLLLPPLVCIPILPVVSFWSDHSKLEIATEEADVHRLAPELPGSSDLLALVDDKRDLMEQAGQKNTDEAAGHMDASEWAGWASAGMIISRLPEFIVGLWACGLVYGLAVAVRRIQGLNRLDHQLQSAGESDQQLLKNLCKEMQITASRVPELKMAGVAISPLVKSWGFAGRPVLILPSLLWESWSEAEKKAVLAHELAHVKRGDDLFAWLGLIVRLLQWHNPLAHWAFRQWSEAGEVAADALALATLGGGVQARRDLAGAIFQTMEFLKNSHRPSPRFQPILQMISTLTSARALKRRVAAIGRFSVVNDESRNRGGWIIGCISLVVLPLGFVTVPQEILTVQAVEIGRQESSELEMTARYGVGEPLAVETAMVARDVQIEISLEERLLVMEEKLNLIQDQVRELRQAKARKLAARKARQAAWNSNAISE